MYERGQGVPQNYVWHTCGCQFRCLELGFE